MDIQTTSVQPKLQSALFISFNCHKMKQNITKYIVLLMLFVFCGELQAQESDVLVGGAVKVENLKIEKGTSKLAVSMDLNLDSLYVA